MFSKSFTLIEVLIGISLLVIVFTGIYGAFQLGIRVVGQSKARVTAIAISNQRIEQIQNLAYKDIGTIGGIPPGSVAETETINRNSVDFIVKTTVVYIDDPFDGVMPADTLPTDYKRIKIKTSWAGWRGGEVTLLTDISPKGIETEKGGGTIKISVLGAWGQGIAGANINVINNQVSPNINANYLSDSSGNLILAGSPTSTQAFQITVDKANFSQDRTYGAEEISSPAKPHLSVFEGQITEISFSIDETSDFSIQTRSRESFDDDFGNWSKISQHSNVALNNNEIKLTEGAGGYETNGYLISIAITPTYLINWDRLIWQDEEPISTGIRYQLFYATGTSFALIPDNDLPENSFGLTISPIDISGLDTNKYTSLKIRGDLSTNSTSTTPIIFDWHITYNTPLIENVDFHLQGLKIIGTDEQDNNVYKYSQDHISNSNGHLDIADLEWDSYLFSLPATSLLDLIETNPSPQPINLSPGTSTPVTLYLSAENTLLLKVQDASTSDPIFAAGSRLYNEGLGYDNIKPTDEKGQTFFIPLEQTTYALEITANGYETAITTVNVSGHSSKTIKLTK